MTKEFNHSTEKIVDTIHAKNIHNHTLKHIPTLLEDVLYCENDTQIEAMTDIYKSPK